MHRHILAITTFLLVILAGSFLAGCKNDPTPSPTPVPTPTLQATASPTPEPTPLPTSTATPEPLGSPGNPLVMGLVPAQKDPQVASSNTEIAHQLSTKTGLTIQSKVFDTYTNLYAALDDKKVHIVWLPPMTYILAHQRGLADVALVSNHFGVYNYGTQFLAHVDSGFTTYFDPISDKNTATLASALEQFAGKRPCWVEPKSVSGYILPAGILADAGVTTLDPSIVQSFNGVVRALYIQQICDFGATFAISGDPRTASSIQDTLPDVMAKVIVIWRTDAWIPNLNLSYSPGVTEALRKQITEALQALVKTPDGKTLLSSANQYNIEDLKAFDDSAYDMLRLYYKAAGIDIKTLIGR